MWHLLLVFTSRKAAHRRRYDEQQRRDVRRNRPDPSFLERDDGFSTAGADRTISREPTPEFAAEFVETCETLFQSRDDPALQQVVALRLEGCTDDEIAGRLRCSRRTVQRRLEVIRRHCGRLESTGE